MQHFSTTYLQYYENFSYSSVLAPDTRIQKPNNVAYKPPFLRSSSETKYGRRHTSHLVPVLMFFWVIVVKSSSYWKSSDSKQHVCSASARNLDSRTSWYGGFVS